MNKINKLNFLLLLMLATVMGIGCRTTGILAARADGDSILAVELAPLIRNYPPLDPAPVIVAGRGIGLRLERAELRAGERWLEILVELEDGIYDKAEVFLTISLYKPGTSKPLTTKRLRPTATPVQVAVDLRTPDMDRIRLQADLHADGKLLGTAEALLTAAPPAYVPEDNTTVAVHLDLPEGAGQLKNWPMTFGMPLPAGTLWDVTDLILTDNSGQAVPFQAEVSGRWARDGAVKWVRFDALIDSDAGLVVSFAKPGPQHKPRNPLKLIDQGDDVTVHNGELVYTVSAGGGLITEVLRDGKRTSAATPRGLYLIDQQERTATACAEGATITVESAGPVSACIRIEGPYRTEDGEELARHITRLEFFAGRPEIEVVHTLVLTRDTNEIWFREAGWEWSVTPGDTPRALFAGGRRVWNDVHEACMKEHDAVYVFQADHEQFGGGENIFHLGGVRARQEEKLHTGELMGDWAALSGSRGGLLISCREAARQHPKEIEISPNRITLKLLSSRGGDELDFRSPALLRRWNRGSNLSEALLQEAGELPSNAAGWSKTHQLLLIPLSGTDTTDAARRARLHSEPVYARVDPNWIYTSRAMGPLYPRDPERFPEFEDFIAASGRLWQPRMFQSGDYGFVDYAAGPHHSGLGSGTVRYHLSYTVRHDMWLLYARGGERNLREFAENSNRTYMDGNICHWDVPDARGPRSQHKYRGMFTTGRGIYGRLPYYWGVSVGSERSTSTNLDQFLFDYYLTGYRRAGEIVANYADGVQRWWEEGRHPGGRFVWREKILLQALTQAYNHTFDPGLIPIVEEIIAYTYSLEGYLHISKDVPHTTSNKIQSDIQPLVQAWEFWGDRRIYDMARAVADYLRVDLGSDVSRQRHRIGVLADFLYRETGDPSIGEAAAITVRQGCAGSPASSSSIAVFGLQGVPYALSTIASTEADRRPAASWVQYQDFGYPASAVARKADREHINIRFRGGREGMRIIPLGETRSWLHRVYPYHLSIPYDSDGGDYQIIPGDSGMNFFLADAPTPLVLYAPEYWLPGPAIENPRMPVFFHIPEKPQRPRIFFEGSARMRDPDGNAWPDESPVSGWQELPADRPGLWSFIPEENHLVRVRNLPPFFAFRNPAAYFVPEDIEWDDAPFEVFEIPSVTPDTVYLPGPGDDPDISGYYLDAEQTFVLTAGPDHPSGEGGKFLPFQDGTVEFWFQPFWGSFDLDARRGGRYDRRMLAQLVMEDQTVYLQYHMCLERVQWPPTRYNYSHTLRANFTTTGPSNDRTPGYIRHIFEPGEWVHVAWVWGQRPVKTRRGLTSGFETRIYINGGSAGQRLSATRVGNQLRHPVQELILGGGPMQGVFADLRVSDTQRYREDFTSPPPGSLTIDRHTRALVPFNGSTNVYSYGANN